MGIMGRAQPLRRTALIVEDDGDQRWLTAMLLQEKGIETVESESAEAALATMLLRGREICLVFADLRLSGAMDGIDLARELKMRWQHLTIILTSGNPGTWASVTAYCGMAVGRVFSAIRASVFPPFPA
jgi:DNA-binding NtrC family response regulator